MAIPNRGIPDFAERASLSIGSAASALRYTDARSTRVLRKFTTREVANFLGVDRSFLYDRFDHPDGQIGEVKSGRGGRERLLSVDEMMLIRALGAGRPRARRQVLHWRKPGERLPVITIASQKGGTAKTLTAAHVAQFAHFYYGMRVGVIDGDPQASCSLYFAGDSTELAGLDTDTFTTFMGVPSPGKPPLVHSPERLDTFWKMTPWPGLRMIPGGVPIQEADISMHFLARGKVESHKRVYRLLRDAIARWEAHHPPRTTPEEFYGPDGRFRHDVYQAALYETLDLIVIDTAPSLSIAQLNAVVAADTLIIPQTMRGFDLSTLRIYLSTLTEYLRFIRHEDDPVNFAPLPSYVLPTIISGFTDVQHIGELYSHDPEVVCPIYYNRSEAVASAAENYQSVYEYDPVKSKEKTAKRFLEDANAVSDAILTRAIPGLPSRGFANAYIRARLNVDENGKPLDIYPLWTEEVEESAMEQQETEEVAG